MQFHMLSKKMHKNLTTLYAQPRAQTTFFLLTVEIKSQGKCNKTLNEEINIASATQQEVLVATVRFIVKERRNGQRVTGLEDRSLVSMNWQRLEGPVFTCTVRTRESSGESNVVLLTGSRGKNLLRKGCRREGKREPDAPNGITNPAHSFPFTFSSISTCGIQKEEQSQRYGYRNILSMTYALQPLILH